MTDRYGSPDKVRATVAAQIAAADARRTRIEALAAELAATSATARSPRGEVEVTAAPSAAVTDIRFTPAALELAPDELSRLVTETVARAQTAAGERALVAAGEALGPDSPFVAELRADVAARAPGRADGVQW